MDDEEPRDIANNVNMLQNDVKVYFHKFGIKLDILECMR
jgi:hypothetical protein